MLYLLPWHMPTMANTTLRTTYCAALRFRSAFARATRVWARFVKCIRPTPAGRRCTSGLSALRSPWWQACWRTRRDRGHAKPRGGLGPSRAFLPHLLSVQLHPGIPRRGPTSVGTGPSAVLDGGIFRGGRRSDPRTRSRGAITFPSSRSHGGVRPQRRPSLARSSWGPNRLDFDCRRRRT